MHTRTTQKLPARISIIGAARSGLAAARSLCQQGVAVFISDACPADKLDLLLAGNGLAHVPHEGGEHTERVLQADAIVVSPGVPSVVPILRQARRRGIPVWSEMELGFRCSTATFLAVTGSSGKSTTVTMLGEIMKATERPSVVAGNIGVPVIGVAPRMSEEGCVVAEVSSFQLENIDTFRPAVAGVVNFMKNHLDRYAHENDYYEAKKQIIRNMDQTDWLILNAADPLLRSWADEISTRVGLGFFGGCIPGHLSVWYRDGAIVSASADGVRRHVIDTGELKVTGRHNFENAAAATAMALAAGADVAAVVRGLRCFEGLEHRLQRIGTFGGVTWYNDSKSTTAESVQVAVSAFPGNVHLIAGGRDKGCDFNAIKPVLAKQVKQIVLIGEAAPRMQSVWRDCTSVVRAKTLQEAVQTTAGAAAAGDVVVFSPGCSSFDMFRNYEERGRVFVDIVRQHVASDCGGRESGENA